MEKRKWFHSVIASLLFCVINKSYSYFSVFFLFYFLKYMDIVKKIIFNILHLRCLKKN